MNRSRLVGMLTSLTVALGLVLASPSANARPRPAGGSSDFQANKEFGLGFMFGNPTGLSGKYYLSTDTALDFALGDSRRYYGDDLRGFHFHMSFLWHPVVLAKPDPFWLPLYFGVGGRFLDQEYFYDRGYGPRLGARIPGGIMMDFNNVPLDIFAELAFVFDFISPDDPYRRSSLHTALGIRYYF